MIEEKTKNEDTHWLQIQELGVLQGMRFMFFIYRWLGRGIFKICLYPVIVYFFLTKKQARQASTEFLFRIRTQGGIPQDANIYYWSFKHFLQFGENLLDKLAAWSGDIREKDIEFYQLDKFSQLVNERKGALVIVSHLGNQEVCRALASANPQITLNILVHTKHAKKFNLLLEETNNNSRLHLIQVTEVKPSTAMMLREKLDAGEVVVIAGDRTPVNGGRQSMVSFLDAPAAFPQGPYILASVLHCPVYLMFATKNNQNYKIFFEPFTDKICLKRQSREADLSFWAQKFADRLSHYTLQFPLQWNNFYHFWGADSTFSDKR
ncbi:hypothetical protein AB835_07910 [Candidatus Endobugula sertula]|uniref:Acyltransferase n=1 Tax=Candidatus Endobugula sertula TaxID=62101 RepID=A0A1D2QPW2_9GAMM|nr:hypothetical protein AB835_07910 [Candidatus Endobugula sertula]